MCHRPGYFRAQFEGKYKGVHLTILKRISPFSNCRPIFLPNLAILILGIEKICVYLARLHISSSFCYIWGSSCVACVQQSTGFFFRCNKMVSFIQTQFGIPLMFSNATLKWFRFTNNTLNILYYLFIYFIYMADILYLLNTLDLEPTVPFFFFFKGLLLICIDLFLSEHTQWGVSRKHRWAKGGSHLNGCMKLVRCWHCMGHINSSPPPPFPITSPPPIPPPPPFPLQ